MQGIDLSAKELTGGKIKKAIVDRGYRIKGKIGSIDIVMPKRLKKESYYLKKQREARCRSRAGIEALISHLKYVYLGVLIKEFPNFIILLW